MNKPNNYDNTSTGDFTPITLGGHRAIIKEVKETQSRSGKDMVTVSIDFAAEDEQAKYFEKQYKTDTRPEKKWPYQAVQNILVNNSEGKTSKSFKSFCTAFENSNGVKIQWGESNWGAQFKNRRIGVVFGAVEEEYNGQVKTRHRIRWFCDDRKALDQSIPEKKGLAGSATSTPTDSGDVWMPFPDGDELPFN